MSIFICALLVFLKTAVVPEVSALILNKSNNKTDEVFEDFVEDNNIFSTDEKINLQSLQKIYQQQQNLKFDALEVVFLWTHRYGSAITRADDASTMVSKNGKPARSEHCKNFCKTKQNVQIIVHVKWKCTCALPLGQVNIFDPIDNMVSYHQMLENGFKVFAGTSVMRDELNAIKNNSAVLLPHHASNFHDRRHRPSDDKLLTLGIAGGSQNDQMRKQLAQCLKSKLDKKTLARVNPVAMYEKEVQCNMKDVRGPSIQGDCIAQKLAMFDIGIAWDQTSMQNKKPTDAWERKPSTRVVNMLSVGIPVVAYDKYVAYRDVSVLGRTATQLASSVAELCDHVAELVVDDSLRGKASVEALQVAEAYTPTSIGKQYIEAFEYFKS